MPILEMLSGVTRKLISVNKFTQISRSFELIVSFASRRILFGLVSASDCHTSQQIDFFPQGKRIVDHHFKEQKSMGWPRSRVATASGEGFQQESHRSPLLLLAFNLLDICPGTVEGCLYVKIVGIR